MLWMWDYEFDWINNEEENRSEPFDEIFNSSPSEILPGITPNRETPLFDPNTDDLNINESVINSILAQCNDKFALTYNPPTPDEILRCLEIESTVEPSSPKLLAQTVLPSYSTSEPYPCLSSSSKTMTTKIWMVFDKTIGRERRPLLYEFLRILLDDPNYSHIAEYLDRRHGIFKLHKPKEVARLWKDVKGRNSDATMTYDKLARAIRYYYSSGIIHSTPGRFTFRFGSRSGFRHH